MLRLSITKTKVYNQYHIIYNTQNEETCDNEPKISPGIIIGIICGVISVLVIGGIVIWRCDVYKRKKFRERALQQALVMDDEEEDDDDDENENVVEEEQQGKENNDLLVQNEDIELETA